jgi:hypothetical protein
MIEMKIGIVPGSCTKRGAAWEASAEIDARVFKAQSRSGTPNALGRILVEQGVADQPVEVFDVDMGMVVMRHRSLHGMAKWTYAEGDGVLRRVRYTPGPEGGFFALGKLKNEGEASRGYLGLGEVV